MKNILISFIIVLLILSCDDNNTQREQINKKVNLTTSTTPFDSSYASKHIIFHELFHRSLDSVTYIKEIHVVNFDTSTSVATLPTYFGDDIVFADDGLLEDSVAGDGLYTSVDTFVHDSINQFLDYNRTPKWGSSVGFGFQFQHSSDLGNYRSPMTGVAKAKIGCKIRLCSCPGECWCLACELFDTYCVDFYDCEASFEIEF